MKALQFRTVGAPPEVVHVPDPEPGPGQVLLKVTAAGVCHSDFAVMNRPAGGLPFDLPLTLGHEGVGTVAAPARVIALDVSDEKLRLAREVGAHEAVRSDAGAAGAVRELTGGIGAEAVFDFVGAAPTVTTAGALAAVEADISIVGIGGGALPVGFGRLPHEASVSAPYWGSRGELLEVLALARTGAVSVHTETFPLDEAPLAYERLHAGTINGRAVILPNG
ncbi:zinc-binding dehydrogenase [Streptomyces sp. NPDC056149]|uniref:zinc-binding dehydrogenase n=1 Tax=Streptomyces sp. NPDC056149 TaxID=3345728 RepID=UPI0035D7BFD0